MPLAIETTNLQKRFGETRAVDGISLGVPRGHVYGLLGPNGAGKTTTIRMLTTLIRPDGGTARVLGHDLVTEASEVRAKVGVTGQFASVDEDLTGTENIVLFARLLGFSWRGARERAVQLLAAFDLTEAASRQVKTYSGGMRRRLDIAASLIVTSELLFLDEPTTGLDPRSRNQVWDIVRNIAAGGTTVLLTTQYMEEADRLADRMAVIDHGKVIAEGTSRELKAQVGGRAVHLKLSDPAQREAAATILKLVLGEAHEGTEPNEIGARVTREDLVPQVLAQLAAGDIGIAEFALAQPSLDDVFLALTGKPVVPA
jgi:ABC-2 type transport system ATP-binding protein